MPIATAGRGFQFSKPCFISGNFWSSVSCPQSLTLYKVEGGNFGHQKNIWACGRNYAIFKLSGNWQESLIAEWGMVISRTLVHLVFIMSLRAKYCSFSSSYKIKDCGSERWNEQTEFSISFPPFSSLLPLFFQRIRARIWILVSPISTLPLSFPTCWAETL